MKVQTYGLGYEYMWPNCKQTRSRSNVIRPYKRYKAIALRYKAMRIELHMWYQLIDDIFFIGTKLIL